MRGSSLGRVLVLAWPWLLALLVLAPLLRPGYVLSYDMVFVPDQAFRSQYLGLGDGLPRAVPSDALVSWLTVIVPSWLLQKAVLLGIIGVGGWGVLRLIPPARWIARIAAVSWFVWNPYVAERLLIGQWVVLVGYAMLPWVLLTALRARTGDARGVAMLVLTLAVGATSASGGLMAALLGLTVLMWRGSLASRAQRLAAVAGAVAVNLPWTVAGLLHRDTAGVGADAIRAFSASGEGHLGVLLSVLGLGGIWNSQTVPDSRLGWIPVLWTVLLMVVIAVGVRPMVTLLGSHVVAALGLVAGVSVILGLAGVVDPGLVARLADDVPGLALLRDGPRYLGGLALFEALAFGMGVQRWASGIRSEVGGIAVGCTLALAPLLVLPDLAWGAAGRLAPVDYPASWSQAREAMVDHGGDGKVLVLPASPYRSYPWNDGTPVLDPAPRFFPNNMLSSDALRVDGVEVQPETPRVAEAYRAFGAGDAEELRRLGVGFVLVDVTDANTDEQVANAVDGLGASTVFEADDIVVLALSDPAAVSASTSDQWAVGVAWGAAAITLGIAIGGVLAGRTRRRRRSARKG